MYTAGESSLGAPGKGGFYGMRSKRGRKEGGEKSREWCASAECVLGLAKKKTSLGCASSGRGPSRR